MPAKFLEQVAARATGQRSYEHTPISAMTDVITTFDRSPELVAEHLLEYRVEVRMGQRVLIKESRSSDLPDAVKKVRHRIARLVYGEVDDALMGLEAAAFDRDWDALKKSIQEIKELIRI